MKFYTGGIDAQETVLPCENEHHKTARSPCILELNKNGTRSLRKQASNQNEALFERRD